MEHGEDVVEHVLHAYAQTVEVAVPVRRSETEFGSCSCAMRPSISPMSPSSRSQAGNQLAPRSIRCRTAPIIQREKYVCEFSRSFSQMPQSLEGRTHPHISSDNM